MEQAFAGVLLGTAVGDAIGLPREGLRRGPAERIFGPPPLRHALIGCRGMCSDDTEHTCMAAQALLASRGEPARFARSLAWRLRGWLLGLPAGVGRATAQSIIKLWLGFPPGRSGVWSAGNGPAMRAAILGVYAGEDRRKLRDLVSASTRLTHTDPAAEHGAMAVALAAAYGATAGPAAVDVAEFARLLSAQLPDTEMLRLVTEAAEAVRAGRAFDEYVKSKGLQQAVSGYVNHTVPAALFCWMRWPGDFRRAVEEIVCAGGDSDTTGAIVGALVGATAGPAAIPAQWLDGLWEWPRNKAWMRRLAHSLASGGGPVPLFWPALLLRNVLFLLVVILHGFRRLLPPY